MSEDLWDLFACWVHLFIVKCGRVWIPLHQLFSLVPAAILEGDISMINK